MKLRLLENANHLFKICIFLLPFSPEISLLFFFFGYFFCLKSFFSKNYFVPIVLFLANLHNFLFFFAQYIFYLAIDCSKIYFSKKIIWLLPILVVFLIVIVSLNYQTNKLFQWVNFNNSTIIQINEFTKILPNDPINSLVVTNIGYLESKNVEYRLKIRASGDFKLRVSFWLPDIQEGKTTFCNLTTVFSDCLISMNIKTRTSVVIVLGEANTWVKTDPYIEIKNTELHIDQKKQFFSWSLPLQRWRGFSFNENAFGAHMAIVGLLAAAYMTNYLLVFLAICPSLLCIFLSGSRGALTAFAIGLLVLFLARSRVYKYLPLVMLVVFSGIVVFQAFTIRNSAVPVTQNQTGLRALNISDQNTTRGRLEIWRLATKAWFENPRTFLIGTGDLSSAMKVKFDARSSGYGLSKDSLTHAHNLWVQTAGESGLLGLFAMLWLWGWVILKAWRSRDAGALALLAAIFVINSVDYLFFYAPVHLAFWMAAAGLKPPEPSPDGFEGSAIVKT